MAANSAVLGPIWPNFKVVLDVMDVLITCKNKEDPIKNESTRVVTRFSLYNTMGAICCHGNQSSDPIWPKTLCSLFRTPMMLQLKFDCWLQRYSCLKVLTHGRTHTHTDAGSTGIL